MNFRCDSVPMNFCFFNFLILFMLKIIKDIFLPQAHLNAGKSDLSREPIVRPSFNELPVSEGEQTYFNYKLLTKSSEFQLFVTIS